MNEHGVTELQGTEIGWLTDSDEVWLDRRRLISKSDLYKETIDASDYKPSCSLLK